MDELIDIVSPSSTNNKIILPTLVEVNNLKKRTSDGHSCSKKDEIKIKEEKSEKIEKISQKYNFSVLQRGNRPVILKSRPNTSRDFLGKEYGFEEVPVPTRKPRISIVETRKENIDIEKLKKLTESIKSKKRAIRTIEIIDLPSPKKTLKKKKLN